VSKARAQFYFMRVTNKNKIGVSKARAQFFKI